MSPLNNAIKYLIEYSMFILFIFYLNIEYSVLSIEYLYNNYKLALCNTTKNRN